MNQRPMNAASINAGRVVPLEPDTYRFTDADSISLGTGPAYRIEDDTLPPSQGSGSPYRFGDA